MNLIGHVAVAARLQPSASSAWLVGAMLPDLSAIARVRLVPVVEPAPADETPDRDEATDLAGGITVHHASDAVFHASAWFNVHNRALRDALLDAGVERGPARACAHAGLEMMMDGHLVADADVADASDRAFEALWNDAPTRRAAAALVAPDVRDLWLGRLGTIGRSLDPRSYASPSTVAERLRRMTQGRPRIELPIEHVPRVARALDAYRPVVARDAPRVVDDVLSAVLASA